MNNCHHLIVWSILRWVICRLRTGALFFQFSSFVQQLLASSNVNGVAFATYNENYAENKTAALQSIVTQINQLSLPQPSALSVNAINYKE